MEESLLYGLFWHHLVYPELAADEAEDPELTLAWVLKKRMRGRFPHFVVCLSLDHYHDLAPDERPAALDAVRRSIRSALPSSLRVLLGFAHGNSIYFCGFLPEVETEESPRAQIIGRLESLLERIARSTGGSATLGVAFVPRQTLGAWRWAAQQAVVAQRRKVRSGGNRVYVVEEEVQSGVSDLSLFWSQSSQLHALVRSGDISKVEAVAAEVLRHLFTENYLPLHHLRPLLQSQIILMAQAAVEVGVDAALVARENERYLESMSAVYDYGHLKEIIRTAATSFTSMVHDRYHCQSSRLVACAEEYIASHLDDSDLGLQHIADALATNPSYLSRCFKKTTGSGVVNSINRLRVERAKLLLLDHKLSITEIAFQLGFGSVQHFGRVFRGLAECSPSQFRTPKEVQQR